MSYSNFLISLETKQVVDLGPMRLGDGIADSGSGQFAGWIDQETGQRVPHDHLLSLIERFYAFNWKNTVMIVPEEKLDALIGEEEWEWLNTIASIIALEPPEDD